MQEQIIRAALYPRVSSEEQVLHGHSLQAQEDALIDYANAHNMKIVGIYRDEGNSARKPALKRPVMLELLDDVKAGKIDRILFIKLDRWFRNVREYHKVQAILEEHNVAWQATQEDYSTATADGRFKVNIMLSVAENEADRTSERIRFVMASKLKRKEVCTGTVSFGYKVETDGRSKRVVKDPETAPYVQEFWDHYRKYESIHLSGLFVNEKYGIKRTYKGWYTTARSEMHTGTWKGVEGYCEPYISREDWERLQQHRIEKSPANPGRVYLFTGLLICPGCGHTLKATCVRQERKNGKIAEYHSYRCSNRRLGICSFRNTVSELKIESALLKSVRGKLEDYVLEVQAIAAEKKPVTATMDVVKLNEQMRRLNRIYMSGNMDDDEYARETAALKVKLEKAKDQEKEERPPDIEVLKQFLSTDFEGIYTTLEPEDKRRLWRSVIKEIHVDKGSVVTDIVPRA